MSDLNKKQVRFAPQVRCRTTLSRCELTTKESASLWYSPKERVKIIDNSMRLVERRKAGKRPRRDDPYRGLEAFQELDYQVLRQEIDACVYAVILEQHRQVVERRYDGESLSNVSLVHSQNCREIALIRGKHDECEAKRILQDTTEVEEDDRSQTAYSVTSDASSSASSTMQGEFEKLGKVLIATAIESRFKDIKT